MTRLKTSLPFWSVPSRCADDGARNVLNGLIALGLYGAISGANTAQSTTSDSINRATAATGSRASRTSVRVAGALSRPVAADPSASPEVDVAMITHTGCVDQARHTANR